MPVVPLFETLSDLRGAGHAIEALLDGELDQRGAEALKRAAEDARRKAEDREARAAARKTRRS